MRIVLILFAVWATAPAQGPGATFIVAANGNDQWSGTRARPIDGDGPFKSLVRARDAMREARRAGRTGPFIILVRGGVHRLDETFTLRPEDSGTPDFPVVFAAYPEERPVISGGRRIGSLKPTGQGAWSVSIRDVAEGRWSFHQLFVNGQRRVRARTPNQGYLRTDGPLPGIKNPQRERKNPAACMGFRFRKGDLRPFHRLQDVNVVTYQSWTAPLSYIDDVDEKERTVRFVGRTAWPLSYWERNQRYHLENLKEGLDAPGEWYLDRGDGVLTYLPVAGEDPGTATFEAPVLQQLVRIDGDPAQRGLVRHVHFRGLAFHHAAWRVEKRQTADGQAAASLGAAILVRGARDVVFSRCEVAHVGEHGLWLERDCVDCRLTRCRVHDLGAGGVRVGHMQSPKAPSEATKRNRIDDCTIQDGGHVFHAGVGVWIGRSSHNAVTHCEISDFDYTGISVGWSWGYARSSAHHNLIERNHVHRIGRGVLSDMGGIYLLGASPGTIVRENVFHDIRSYAYGGWGLYTDEGSSFILLEGNLVYDTKTGGFHQHYGKENVVRHNVFAFARLGQLQRSRQEAHVSFIFERNIIVLDGEPVLHGAWGNGHFRVDHNLYWDVGGKPLRFGKQDWDAWRRRGFDAGSQRGNPGFIDAAGRDFRLPADAAARRLGFRPVDPTEVGPRSSR
ncbi:MAG: hypothetical protein CMJ83_09615 [Planctomycetes bacterium]|nr:hypothetical protein [Planctomycetota bacterium]